MNLHYIKTIISYQNKYLTIHNLAVCHINKTVMTFHNKSHSLITAIVSICNKEIQTATAEISFTSSTRNMRIHWPETGETGL